jgi:hypothetical protein
MMIVPLIATMITRQSRKSLVSMPQLSLQSRLIQD